MIAGLGEGMLSTEGLLLLVVVSQSLYFDAVSCTSCWEATP